MYSTLVSTEYFAIRVHSASGAAPGECYYYIQNPFKVGMMLHLFCILPAAFLVCFQFVPVIRHNVILFHRINGYLVILISLIASAGTIIIAQHAFGGDMATRAVVGALVISTTVAHIFAYLNIKRLQIDQHRAWMMRAWAYFSCIITIRLIMFTSGPIISMIGGFFVIRPCAQINFVLGEKGTLHFYPDCQSFYNGNQQKQIIVEADFFSQDPIALAASLGLPFGSAGWLAFWLHAIIIEFYLRLTPAETERLKQASYERQVERGWKKPGAAGLSSQRFGDANRFVPEQKNRNGGGDEIGMLDSQGRKPADDDEDH